ncbi:hypothetical protein KQX54_011400 [Cotesia glomerata]|uniref:Uncharacterized protein n=1 Tax=Cotesia glomerata TaxID=32391 RepID=A0AAV7IQY5_COTGL|nr:hypothetical protein KQX54_011400 [Cotesia glomerata]
MAPNTQSVTLTLSSGLISIATDSHTGLLPLPVNCQQNFSPTVIDVNFNTPLINLSSLSRKLQQFFAAVSSTVFKFN